ncbi:hypothetical protein BLOT_001089 [Blomia tropicalis]|nr:hypothetical protein BLOT_001089 [Blomia tropicalis]
MFDRLQSPKLLLHLRLLGLGGGYCFAFWSCCVMLCRVVVVVFIINIRSDNKIMEKGEMNRSIDILVQCIVMAPCTKLVEL